MMTKKSFQKKKTIQKIKGNSSKKKEEKPKKDEEHTTPQPTQRMETEQQINTSTKSGKNKGEKEITSDRFTETEPKVDKMNSVTSLETATPSTATEKKEEKYLLNLPVEGIDVHSFNNFAAKSVWVDDNPKGTAAWFMCKIVCCIITASPTLLKLKVTVGNMNSNMPTGSGWKKQHLIKAMDYLSNEQIDENDRILIKTGKEAYQIAESMLTQVYLSYLSDIKGENRHWYISRLKKYLVQESIITQEPIEVATETEIKPSTKRKKVEQIEEVPTTSTGKYSNRNSMDLETRLQLVEVLYETLQKRVQDIEVEYKVNVRSLENRINELKK